MRVLIVGNGVAGIEAALALRDREPDWPITIVSEESDHFFSRTALMYVLSGQLRHQDTEPHERDLYARAGFTRVRARAVGVDVPGRRLLLAGGLDPLPFDRLLLALGSRPRPAPWPGAELAGVGHFVTLQDLEWLERELWGGPGRGGRPAHPDAHHDRSAAGSPYLPRPVAAEARGSLARQPVVIGGGLIGVEVVETLLAKGLRPTFLIREEWFWPIALCPEEAKWIGDRLAEHGVDMRLQANVAELVGEEGRLVGVETDQGRIPADLAVVAIGVLPNTDWLQGSGLELEPGGGIRVGPDLSTSAPGIYAAGDCASVPWFDGRRRPEQLWYTGRDQGRVAGRSMAGDPVSYQRGTWYNSAKLMDIEYTTVGLVDFGAEGARTWWYEEPAPVRSTIRLRVREGKVIGFNLLGRRWDHALLVRWLEEGRRLPWVVEHLRTAAFDTELVPRLRLPRGLRANPSAALLPD